MNAAVVADPQTDELQSRVIFHPPAAGSLAVRGAAGTGKTFALLERARRLAREGAALLVTAPSDAGVLRLREALAQDVRTATCAPLGEVAFSMLRDFCQRDVEPIDDVAASLHFQRAGAALFALEWTEFVSAEIDPEITGLRTPERFAAAAFRLIRKLRASLISVDDFRSIALRGAANFYANPPNFADADLIAGTPPKYRDSLRAGPAELERQRRREVDLVRILARLYQSYVDALVRSGCLTPTDAVYEATLGLRSADAARRQAAARYDAILIDDAQDLGPAQLALLETIAKPTLSNLTFAGDEAQSTRSFAGGGRGSAAMKNAALTVELRTPYRSDAAIERTARALLQRNAGAMPAPDPSVALYRAADMRDEARYVASEIAKRIASGTPAWRIAIVARNLRCAGTYVDALLARDIAVDIAGTASLFDFRGTGDALAALWSAVDPYRHDYLLRMLASPCLGLSDASLAILCGDAPNPQPLLFEMPHDDGARRARGTLGSPPRSALRAQRHAWRRRRLPFR